MFLADDKCSTYQQKQNIVVDEGGSLGTSYGYTVEECKVKCSETDGCQNFRYCPSTNKCFHKDKKILDSTPEQTGTSCFTVYQDCEDGSLWNENIYFETINE